MRGAVPPATSMPRGSRALMALRARPSPADAAARPIARRRSPRRARAAPRSSATSGNTLATYDAARRQPRCAAVVFHELIGFNARRSASAVVAAAAQRARRADGRSPRLRPSLVPHAPYSVSPALLSRDRARDRGARAPFSVHLGESRRGSRVPARPAAARGASCSKQLGAWNAGWTPPGVRAGRVSRSARARSTTGCSPCTACSSTDAELARLAAARRDARDLSAQQRLDRRRRRRRSTSSTRRACGSRSAPTASRASPT